MELDYQNYHGTTVVFFIQPKRKNKSINEPGSAGIILLKIEFAKPNGNHKATKAIVFVYIGKEQKICANVSVSSKKNFQFKRDSNRILYFSFVGRCAKKSSGSTDKISSGGGSCESQSGRKSYQYIIRRNSSAIE